MARIRTIKPDYVSHIPLVKSSFAAECLFIRLKLFCDDNGIIPVCIDTFKIRCFPGKEISTHEIEQLITELIDNKCMYSYAVNGRNYLYVIGWHEEGGAVYESIEQNRRQIIHPTPNLSTVSWYLRRNCAALSSWKGREGNGDNNINTTVGSSLGDYPHKICPPVDNHGSAVKIRLRNQSFCVIKQFQIEQWQKIFPEIDVQNEILRLSDWYEKNPKRRKMESELIDHIMRCLKMTRSNPKAKPKQTKATNVLPFAKIVNHFVEDKLHAVEEQQQKQYGF